MARVKKKEVPPHIVIPDTSVLWHADKTLVVDPAFDAFWDQHSKEFHLQLVVPDVVKGEILFQQTTSATRATGQIDDLMSKVSAISAHRYSHRIKPDELKRRVESRFDKWLASHHGKTEAVPQRIDWPRLVNDAIWRVPPFAEDRDNKDFEKGFRDCIILETVVEYCKHHTQSDISIALVCGDSALRDAADARLADDARFSCYETFAQFSSYLQLTRQELTNQFIRNILRRASSKFFAKGDDTCLAKRGDIPAKIREKYPTYFADPTVAQKDSLGLLASMGFASEKKWEAVDRGMFWVGNTAFDRIEDTITYHWKTTVTFAQLFQRQEMDVTGPGLDKVADVLRRRVLVLPVIVSWHARVTSDARFHDIELGDMNMTEKDFRPPTADDRKAFKIQDEASNKAMDSDEG